MLKKAIITIIIIILVAVGIFGLVNLFLPHQATTEQPNRENAEQPEQEPEKDHAAEKDDDSEDNDTNEDEDAEDENNDDQTFTDKVSDAINDAIQQTVDYFQSRETNVVAIGDSLTQGVGDSTGNGGYIGILDDIVNEKKQVATFDNFGKRGNRSDQMLERMEEPEIEAALEEADIILITIGANDIMKIVKQNITDLQIDAFKSERESYETRLHAIFDKMKDYNENAEIYLLGFYNPFKEFFQIRELDMIVSEWNKTGENTASEYDNITYIPTKDLFENEEDDLLADDNFHPNKEGYELMAERVLEYVGDRDPE